jgi:hypothetical protein
MRMNGLIERRSVGRTAISKAVRLFFSEQRDVATGVVVDITNVGARIRLNGPHLRPAKFELSFDKFRTVRICRLIWRRDDLVGIAFVS